MVSMTLRCALMVLVACAGSTLVTAAATAEPGWQVSSFANGFTSCFNRNPANSVGPIGITFVGEDLFINDHDCYHVWKFPNALSLPRPLDLSLTSPYLLTTVSGYAPLTDYAATADGKLYMTTRGPSGGSSGVFEVNTTTGWPSRTLVLLTGRTLGLAADPTNPKRLIFTDDSQGVGVYEIPDKDAATPTFNKISGLFPNFDGVQVGPDGNIWASEFTNGHIRHISNDGATVFGRIPTGCSLPDGIVVASDNSYIVVNCAGDGQARQVFANGTNNAVWTGGSRGDFVTVGPDGCMYATQSVEILRVSLADGTCPFAKLPGSVDTTGSCDTCTNTVSAPTTAPAGYQATSTGHNVKLCFN